MQWKDCGSGPVMVCLLTEDSIYLGSFGRETALEQAKRLGHHRSIPVFAMCTHNTSAQHKGNFIMGGGCCDEDFTGCQMLLDNEISQQTSLPPSSQNQGAWAHAGLQQLHCQRI